MNALFVLLAAAVGIVVLFSTINSKKRFDAVLKALAEELGLGFVPSTWRSSAQAEGRLEDTFQVVVDTYTEGSGKSSKLYTRVRVGGFLPGDLTLGEEGFGSAVGKLFKGEDLQTGDALFDSAALVRGPDVDTLARLDATGRQATLEALALGIHVSEGEVVRTERGLAEAPGQLRLMVDQSLDLARALDHGGDPVGRLVRGLAEDPSVGYRLRALTELVRRGGPESEQAARAAAGSENPRLRLTGAMALGEAGAPIVAGVAADPQSAPAAQLEATRWVARRHPDPDPTLQAVARSGDFDAAAVALEALTERDVSVPLEVLAWRADMEPPALRVQVARALPKAGVDLALTLLADDEVSVVAAAAATLGRIGGVQQVQALQARGEGLLTSGDIKKATAAAVEAIQSGLGDVERGGLALAEDGPQAGRLSVPEGEAE
jgi:hypothetical protein